MIYGLRSWDDVNSFPTFYYLGNSHLINFYESYISFPRVDDIDSDLMTYLLAGSSR